MKLGTFVLACGFSLGLASSASADCVHPYNGVLYPVGYQACFDGWLQECTHAEYWGAIGMCRATDEAGQPGEIAASPAEPTPPTEVKPAPPEPKPTP